MAKAKRVVRKVRKVKRVMKREGMPGFENFSHRFDGVDEVRCAVQVRGGKVTTTDVRVFGGKGSGGAMLVMFHQKGFRELLEWLKENEKKLRGIVAERNRTFSP